MFGLPAEMWGASAPFTGGAWLSSARVVRCWVKSRNERNPRSMLPARNGGGSWGTARGNSEGGGGEGKASCPLCSGLHTCYKGRDRGPRKRGGGRNSQNPAPF